MVELVKRKLLKEMRMWFINSNLKTMVDIKALFEKLKSAYHVPAQVILKSILGDELL